MAVAALAGVAPFAAVDLGLAGVPEKVALAAPLDSSYAAEFAVSKVWSVSLPAIFNFNGAGK